MSDVSSVLAILQAGYEAQAAKSEAKSTGWVACKVEGIDFECIADALRGFSEELIAKSNILVLTAEEYEARDTTATYLSYDDKYVCVNYGFEQAAKLFAQAGLSFERL
jgi:hypothetical protein